MGDMPRLALSMPQGLDIEKPETNTIVNRRKREKNGLWPFEQKHTKLARKAENKNR